MSTWMQFTARPYPLFCVTEMQRAKADAVYSTFKQDIPEEQLRQYCQQSTFTHEGGDYRFVRIVDGYECVPIKSKSNEKERASSRERE